MRSSPEAWFLCPRMWHVPLGLSSAQRHRRDLTRSSNTRVNKHPGDLMSAPGLCRTRQIALKYWPIWSTEQRQIRLQNASVSDEQARHCTGECFLNVLSSFNSEIHHYPVYTHTHTCKFNWRESVRNHTAKTTHWIRCSLICSIMFYFIL